MNDDNSLVAVSNQSLSDIADALRIRLESTDTFSPGEMAQAIMNITYGVYEIKGADETEFRSGSVIMSATDVGALPKEGTAVKATSDADGNVISDTYLKKTSVLSKGSATVPVYFDTVGEAIPIDSYAGNAATASKLSTQRLITIGNTSKYFDGSENLSFTREEIGAMRADAVLDSDDNYVLEIGY